MQCFEFEALCRVLVNHVNEFDADFDLLDAADFITDFGVESITQLDDVTSIARAIELSMQRAA